MKIQVITLFPEMFEGVLNTSMLRKAQDKKLVEYKLINLRNFGIGPRKQVDDTPYGGGDGMVLRVEPLLAAVQHAMSSIRQAQDRSVTNRQSLVVLMTPRGKKFTQAKARELSRIDNLILVCGRYEGYDERVTSFIDEQISIGDYVLTGGELPAMVVIDAVTRLIPGVLGGTTSAVRESFAQAGVVEYPQYTRPEKFRGLKVPKVLLSGHHAEVEKWRTGQQRKK
ncbi:tRNA (guanosine(37)-N1)-methyltransferase TrmD [Candidatus Saccharibacteria bacterium]|nr:tRNA (guanosine(37)-N1)-methyltransferase TrmD [Candidatus Saccharibacteria bacterium]